jgi:hypothetical protein
MSTKMTKNRANLRVLSTRNFLNGLYPMRHKHPHRVRIIRIDVEDVCLAQEIGQQQIVFAAVPLDSDPADIPEPKVEHHEGRGIRSCPIFSELRPILDEAIEIFGDKSEYVVAAPQYRAAANTAMGWLSRSRAQ